MSSARDRILKRIRESAPAPQEPAPPEPPEVDESIIRQLPRDLSPGERLKFFEARIVELGDSFLLVDGWAEAREWIMSRLREHADPPARVCIDLDALAQLGLSISGDRPVDDPVLIPASEAREKAFSCTHGISLAKAAVAETGTIVMTSGEGRSRLSSLVPEIHFALVPASCLLSDIYDLILDHPGPAHAVTTWITGSSRTADIDGVLIHGAHGPRKLVVIVVKQEE